MQGFKAFLLRGNVVDLAVGVVIGVAFGAVVTGFVKDLVTPLIAAIGGNPNFGGLYFTVNNSKFLYGDFFNLLLSFLLIAAVIYFLVVLTKKCTECLSEIPRDARRCAFCTSPQAA